LPADAESRGGEDTPVAIDARLKQFQELVVRPVHVVGEHLVGVAFGDEHVSAHRLGEETEAEHGGVIRRCYHIVWARKPKPSTAVLYGGVLKPW